LIELLTAPIIEAWLSNCGVFEAKSIDIWSLKSIASKTVADRLVALDVEMTPGAILPTY
jgi:hypothetical protein